MPTPRRIRQSAVVGEPPAVRDQLRGQLSLEPGTVRAHGTPVDARVEREQILLGDQTIELNPTGMGAVHAAGLVFFRGPRLSE